VDDPYYYGQIAAVNALSDVYAMGGRPLTAMNIVCFPCRKLGTDILVEILRGGALKVSEAGALLVGGHTINDDEPKYGLAVTGVAAPGDIFTKGGFKPGDQLILTKPLGSGIITTAVKGELVIPTALEEMIHWMTTLNKDAAEVARAVGVKTCTDITGFGLLGHVNEMIGEGGFDSIIYLDSIPLVNGVIDLAEQGLVPGGAKSNREYVKEKLVSTGGMNIDIWLDILCDPQTSGGLLMAVDKEKSKEAVELLKNKGLSHAAVIGEISEGRSGMITLR
jgi:selenide, water dikinase